MKEQISGKKNHFISKDVFYFLKKEYFYVTIEHIHII